MRTRNTARRAEADDEPEPRAQAMHVGAATDTLLRRERESRTATVTANLGVQPENESEVLPVEAAVEAIDDTPVDEADAEVPGDIQGTESGTSEQREDLTTRKRKAEWDSKAGERAVQEAAESAA
jgi:hypothetical protein